MSLGLLYEIIIPVFVSSNNLIKNHSSTRNVTIKLERKGITTIIIQPNQKFRGNTSAYVFLNDPIQVVIIPFKYAVSFETRLDHRKIHLNWIKLWAVRWEINQANS